jgi:ABC-type Fe3+-hydroxamate transport system substrate-binding protein
VRRIIALQPDLVVLNQEENRRKDAETLRAAGIPVWVTVTRTVPGALNSVRRLITVALGWDEPEWLLRCLRLWSQEVPPPAKRVAVPIWRDPWMVVGRDTFAGDLLARLGCSNVFADHRDRYPRATPSEIAARRADLVLLPDEPYPFTAADGPEAFPATAVALVEGRLLTWYGPSLLLARAELTKALRMGSSGCSAGGRPAT